MSKVKFSMENQSANDNMNDIIDKIKAQESDKIKKTFSFDKGEINKFKENCNKGKVSQAKVVNSLIKNFNKSQEKI